MKKTHTTFLTAGGRDSWFMKKDGKICRIIGIEDENLTAITIPRRLYKNFFADPVPTKEVGVIKVKITHGRVYQHMQEN